MPAKFLNPKILAVILTLTTWVLISAFFTQSARTLILQADHQLETDAEKVRTILDDEVLKYQFGLQGAKGALIADQLRFDPKVYLEYAQSRDMFSNFDGVLGFGFLHFVKDADLKKYETKTKASRSNFSIHPLLKTDRHIIVELFEPRELAKNGFGFDFASEPLRREAAETAARTGKFAVSKKLTMTHQMVGQDGLIYFIPVYKTAVTPTSEAERLQNLVGWVFASVTLNSLFHKLNAKIPPHLSVQIQIDNDLKTLSLGEEVTQKFPILSPKAVRTEIGGQPWLLTVTNSNPNLNRSLLFLLVIYVSGILFSGVAGVLVYQNVLRRDQSVAESKNWLKAVINGAGHAVITAGQDGLINNLNPAAEKMLGYKASELIGKATPAIFHDPKEIYLRAEELSKELGRHILPGLEVFMAKTFNGISEVHEWTYIRKDQSRLPVRLCLTAMLGPEGRPLGYVGIAEDLSEQKNLTATIEDQRARMTESAKMSLLGEMAGGIAHEINTPLAMILLKTGLLVEEIEQKFPEQKEMIEDLNKISGTAHRISKIVKGLRLFSRKADNDPMEEVLISSVVESALDLCREKIGNLSIQLKVEIQQDTVVSARAAELAQVLMNLIGNSLDAVQNLPEKWISISAEVTEHTVLLRVTDSGAGIPPAVVDRMMNPFFTTKELGKGTGLGLSISKGIIETHGGLLKYDSSSKNTCFVVQLPKLNYNASLRAAI